MWKHFQVTVKKKNNFILILDFNDTESAVDDKTALGKTNYFTYPSV